MKMFSRLRSKLLCAKDNTFKPEPDWTCQNAMLQRCDEELLSYLNPLLAIGTFGGNLKDSCKGHENTKSKEFGEDNKVLDRLLPNHHTTIGLISSWKSEEQRSVSMKKSLDTFPEVEEKADNFKTENKAIHHPKRTTSGKNGMYKQSFSFLLERQLLYRNDFLPSPLLKERLPDPKVDNSRMKKILRAMLRKKKYHQRQKYLDTVETDEGEAKCGNWVKTDSDYIVLEL